MDFYSVIDNGAIVWDLDTMELNERRYSELTLGFMEYIKVMEIEKPKILFRKEFREHLLDQYPWAEASKFWDLSRSVYAFLADADMISFTSSINNDTTATPDIIYDYYSDPIKQEVSFLIKEMHTREDEIKYFTFCPIWPGNTQLVTMEGHTPKTYETIVHCTSELQNFIDGLRPKFQHSEKHDRLIRRIDLQRGHRLVDGKKIYPFSANYSRMPNRAQNLLDKSINHALELGKLYFYDDESHTFVCFVRTGGRVYHGFDVPAEELHEPIRIQVMQKYNEQKN